MSSSSDDPRESLDDDGDDARMMTLARRFLTVTGDAPFLRASSLFLARFVAMGDEGEASSLSERVLRRGMRGMLAKAHAEGRAVSSGAVACEDAFDLAVTSRGFFRENWGVVVEEAMPRAVREVRRRFGLDRAREDVREETGRETREASRVEDTWEIEGRYGGDRDHEHLHGRCGEIHGR